MYTTRPKRSHDRDFTVAEYVGRISSTGEVRPRHVRLAGLAFLLTALMCFTFTLGDISWERRFFPKLVVLIPTALSLGVWFLVDARALAAGHRRHQKVILWGCVGVSFVVSVAVSEALRRGAL